MTPDSAAATANEGQSKQKQAKRKRLGVLGQKLQPLIGLVLITVILMILAPSYRQWPAIRDVLENSTVMLIMATGTIIPHINVYKYPVLH